MQLLHTQSAYYNLIHKFGAIKPTHVCPKVKVLWLNHERIYPSKFDWLVRKIKIKTYNYLVFIHFHNFKLGALFNRWYFIHETNTQYSYYNCWEFCFVPDGDQIERARSQHTAAACISIRYKNCASIIIIMQGDYVAKWNQSQLKWLYTWRNKRGRTTAALGTHGGEPASRFRPRVYKNKAHQEKRE